MLDNMNHLRVVPPGAQLMPVPPANIQVQGAVLNRGVQIFVKLSRCVPDMADNHRISLQLRHSDDDPDEDDSITINFEKDEFPLSVLPQNSAVRLSDLTRCGYGTDTLVDMALSKAATMNAKVMISRTGPRCAREVMIQVRVGEFFTCRRLPCADVEKILTFFP